jgi:hypothetical protein
MSYVIRAAAIWYGSKIRAYLGEFGSGGSLVAVIANKRIQNLNKSRSFKEDESFVVLCGMTTEFTYKGQIVEIVEYTDEYQAHFSVHINGAEQDMMCFGTRDLLRAPKVKEYAINAAKELIDHTESRRDIKNDIELIDNPNAIDPAESVLLALGPEPQK